MPEAIATTKRRFEKVLETLSNPPAAHPKATEPAMKRARRSGSAASSLLKSSPKADAPSSPPNFSPWSHETFLARLKTFNSVSVWHPKPEPINEVQWAKRGWICVDVNTVACRGGCGKRVVVSLEPSRKWKEEEMDDDEQAAYEDALVRRYASLIVEGHSAGCYWRQSGCKDDIYRLQVVRPSIWHGELRIRYTSLLSIGTCIKDVNLKASDGPPTALPPAQLLEDLPKEILTLTDTPVQPWSAKALELALHGWRGSSDSGNDLLRCDACFQRVGLWMYQPDCQSSRNNSRVATTAEEDEDDDPIAINVLEMHREHCPWRNPESQKASGSLAGMNASQILQHVISNHAREHRRKEKERLRAAQTPDASEHIEDTNDEVTFLSREEVAEKDKERESRLRRLKSLFSIKRRPTSKPPRPKSAVL